LIENLRAEADVANPDDDGGDGEWLEKLEANADVDDLEGQQEEVRDATAVLADMHAKAEQEEALVDLDPPTDEFKYPAEAVVDYLLSEAGVREKRTHYVPQWVSSSLLFKRQNLRIWGSHPGLARGLVVRRTV
jgi:hypothetical protein